MTFTFDQAHAYFAFRITDGKVPHRGTFTARCPFHGDRTASMSVNLDKGGVWYCHACGFGGGIIDFERRLNGGSDAECWARINQTIGREDRPSQANSVEYDYHDASDNVVFQSVRIDLPDGKKKFFQRRPDGKGGWIKNLNGVRRVLFNLPAVMKADVVLIAEGEKDALNLQRVAASFPKDLTYAATTNAMGAGKWEDAYSVHFKGRMVFIFGDNDDPGREHVRQVALSVAKEAASVHLVEMPGLKDKGDVSDYLTEHTGSELFALMQAAPAWTPGGEASTATSDDAAEGVPAVPPANDVWRAESMHEFLNEDDTVVDYYVPDMIAPGKITEIFSPRGLGKTIYALSQAVALAQRGLRVLYLNRDNPRSYIQDLLFGFGVDETFTTFSYIGRERCPSLTEPEKWGRFPYDLYDVVIVDSFDSAAEGVGEQDSAKPAKALAPLLDLCRKKNGPAVVVLCNTVKTGRSGRGSGVIEDRADIIYQVRDGTGFKPTKPGNWVDELPPEGAADWAARSTRRQLRTKFRLATICTKIRGVQPAPRCLEVNLEHEPYTVTDVTAEIDREGEAARMDAVRRKANHHGDGVRILREEIERRAEVGESAIKKKEAENWLTEGDRFKRAEARQITADRVFVKTPVQGRGNPVLLTLIKIEPSAQIDHHKRPAFMRVLMTPI